MGSNKVKWNNKSKSSDEENYELKSTRGDRKRIQENHKSSCFDFDISVGYYAFEIGAYGRFWAEVQMKDKFVLPSLKFVINGLSMYLTDQVRERFKKTMEPLAYDSYFNSIQSTFQFIINLFDDG